KQVDGWQVPPALMRRVRRGGYGLRFSLTLSLYHAGSRRFYGNTFTGQPLAESDESR
ncbi:unnamed protein product, partial [Discosporangium mesarthrocarpum]